jgi:hypothetical protein
MAKQGNLHYSLKWEDGRVEKKIKNSCFKPV